MDIGGTSYNPADLMVEEGKVVTLPEEASFGDAELSLEALPEEAPANAVALLQYVYNERKVGQAYLLDKTIQVPAETEPSGGDAAEPGTEDGSGETGSAAQEPEPTETASVDPEKTDGRFSMKLPEGCDPWCDPGGPGSPWGRSLDGLDPEEKERRGGGSRRRRERPPAKTDGRGAGGSGRV